MKEAFKKIDAFGEGIKFTVNKQKTFSTSLGAIITLVIYVIVMIYAQLKGDILYNRLDTSHQTIINEDDIDEEDGFSFEQM